MAIQMRRGSYSDFVPSRMLAGEFAVMTSDDPNTPDGKSAYVALSPNDVERLLTETDLGDMTDAAERAEAAIEAIGDISELAVPLMTQDVRGGAKLGAGLSVADDTLSLSGESYTSAEKTKLAGIEAGANDYTLPVASPSTLGGVKPDGTTITVDSDGTIHGSGGGGDVSGVKGDAESTYRTGNVNLTPANIGAAASNHTHSAADITSGVLSINHGGTGSSNESQARANLGSMPMFTCDTAASNATKIIYSSSLTPSMYNGARFLVRFTNGNTNSANLRLQYSNSLSVGVKIDGQSTSSTNPLDLDAGDIAEFIIYQSDTFAYGAHYLGKITDRKAIDGGAAGTLADAEDAITDLTADVDALRDSVAKTTETTSSNAYGNINFTAPGSNYHLVGCHVANPSSTQLLLGWKNGGRLIAIDTTGFTVKASTQATAELIWLKS